MKIIWPPFIYVISSLLVSFSCSAAAFSLLLEMLLFLAFLLLGIFIPQISAWLSPSLLFGYYWKNCFFSEAFSGYPNYPTASTSCTSQCFMFFFLAFITVWHLIYFTSMCYLFSASPSGTEGPWRWGFMCLVTNVICPLNSTWHIPGAQ